MIGWFYWLLLVVLAFGVASLLALWSYGRFAKRARGAPAYALPLGDDTLLDRLAAPLAGAHPGQTGLGGLFDNRGAFQARLATIRQAGRSLDMLYYIWRDDLTGRLLLHEILRAADRGVRVRILLDDVNVLGYEPGYLALNGHPGIEVRIFNPVRNRQNALRRGMEMLLALVRYNRRMHCKALVGDGRVAIVGGRNIGDTYFGAARLRRRNSRDADLLMLGAGVEVVQSQVDAYWNCAMALPISALWADHETDLPRYRGRLARIADTPRARRYLASLPADRGLEAGLHWSDKVEVIFDPPEKAQGDNPDLWMPQRLRAAMVRARHSLKMVTPYLVPGRQGTATLSRLARRGVRVEVVTNALASTNQLVVHGAYRRYRRPLLARGVRLYEFAPPDENGHRGEMMHSKTFIIDGRLGFVGSFNYDLRSAFLNTEMGVLFEIPELVAELEAEFARASAPAEAFHLMLEGRRLRWILSDGSRMFYEPDTNWVRRALSWVIGHLPIHRFL